MIQVYQMSYKEYDEDMLTLILLLVFGSLMTFVSLQNTLSVPITVLDYTFPQVPLFFVIIGSMLVGILLSYLIHLVQSLSTAWTIRGKDKKIVAERKELAELTKKYHQLELENARLSSEKSQNNFENKSL